MCSCSLCLILLKRKDSFYLQPELNVMHDMRLLPKMKPYFKFSPIILRHRYLLVDALQYAFI